jgi:hypothetical protein
LLLLVALPASAQIGKQPTVRAGTPEDKALLEIDNATDAAQKLELLNKFLADFGQGDAALLAYERFMAHYLAEKNYAKVFEYGDKTLALDPGNFSAAINMLRAAHEKGDTAKAFDYGDRIGAILQRFKNAPPPEGSDPTAWKERKGFALEHAQEEIGYVHSALLTLANQAPDPAAKIPLLDRYIKAFPDSAYLGSAQVLMAALMTLQADNWSDKGEQLDKAESYAKSALDVLAQAQKPAQLSDEQWAQQKALQQGLAQSVMGQVHIHKGRNAQAVDAFRAAAPLLKADPPTYARNQYRLGFALLNLKRNPEARTAFTEAAAINSPYRALAQQKLNELGGARRPAKKRS